MGIPKEKPDGKFTYADYASWPEDERWELIQGEAYAMSPAPNRWHQGLLGNLSEIFRKFFKGKQCKVYFAPFDVILPAPGDDGNSSDTVVQPDLVVICDPSKLTDAGCTGAPDMVIEILSPSTFFRDMDEKLKLYEARKVKEYWIVNPANRTVLSYRLGSSLKFEKPRLASDDDSIECELFHGLTVSLAEVFRE